MSRYDFLSDEHRRELVVESGISDEVLKAAGIYSTHDHRHVADVLGFDALLTDHLPALVFPYRRLDGLHPTLHSVKPRIPLASRSTAGYGDARLRKYLRTKGELEVYLPPSIIHDPARLDRRDEPLIVTEGEKKVLAAETFGYLSIGIAGVHCWGRSSTKTRRSKVPFPALSRAAENEREVFIVFDSDSSTNRNVAAAEQRLADALRGIGAIVYVVRLPPLGDEKRKCGLDDFLAARGKESFNHLLESTKSNPPPLPTVLQDKRTEQILKERNLAEGLTFHFGALEETESNYTKLLHRLALPASLDARTLREIVSGPFPWDGRAYAPRRAYPRNLDDNDILALQTYLSEEFGVELHKQTVSDKLSLLANANEVDHVEKYFSSLRWDGVARLDTVLIRHLGARDDGVVRSFASKWFISAVARTFEPGCQVDHVLVLLGGQGIGKSTFFRTIAPLGKYVDEVGDLRNKDAALTVQEAVIVELAEIERYVKGRSEIAKAFLTRTVDDVRLPYGRRNVQLKRRCVFAGTTNASVPFDDPTGLRRFWPVRCDQALVSEHLNEERDQLWAEARARYCEGEKWYLDPCAEREALAHQSLFQSEDPWEEQIAKLVANRDEVSVSDIAQGLRLPVERQSKSESNRIASILPRLGFARAPRRRVNGVRTSPWSRMKADPPSILSHPTQESHDGGDQTGAQSEDGASERSSLGGLAGTAEDNDDPE